MAKTSIAQAYVQIIPSADGISGSISQVLEPESQKAGTSAGKSIASSISGAMGSVGKKMSATITAPIVGIATASISSASTFESSMAQVATIADDSSVSLDDLRKQVLGLSNQTGVSASEIASATYGAISAGQDTAEAVNFVAEASKLAKAGFTDLETSTDTLTTALNAYGLESSEVSSVSDKLITTQNLGKTTVAELGNSLGKVIPTAAAYGVNLDQLASAYVTTTKNGIATAESGTYINSMLNELGKSGTTASDVLKDKTGQSFTELMNSGSSLSDVLMILQEEADNTGVSMMDMFGSAEAAKAASSIVQHSEDFTSAVIAMGDSAGTTSTAFEQMSSTSQMSFELMKTQASNAMIELGTAILPSIIPVIEQITGKIQEFSTWWSGLDANTQQTIISIAGITAAAGPLLAIGGKAISVCSSIGSGIGGLIGHFTSATSAVTTTATAATQAGSAASTAGTGFGTFAGQALKIVAVGAAVALVGVGIKLLADSAIALADAGAPAGIAMAGLAVGIAALAAGAALVAPALTAGAAGLVAFGAAVTLVGVGVLAASAGITLLAAALPPIAANGAGASAAILGINVAILAFTAASAAATVSTVALAASLVAGTAGFAAFTVGVTAAGAGMTVLGAGTTVAAAGMVALGAATELVASQMKTIGDSASSSAAALAEMVTSVSIVKEGLNTLKDSAKKAIDAVKSVFSSAGPTLAAETTAMMNSIATAASTSVQTMYAKMAANTTAGINLIVAAMRIGTTSVQLQLNQLPIIMGNATDKTYTVERTAVLKMQTLFMTSEFKMTLLPQIITQMTTNTNKSYQTAQSSLTKHKNLFNTTEFKLTKLPDVVTQMGTSMSSLYSKAQTELTKLQNLFSSTKFELNKNIALPHFSMSGSFNAQTGSVPSVNVNWYKNGGILTSATIFGMSGGNLLGGGEAGPEAVLPIAKLKDYMEEVLESHAAASYTQNITINSPQELSPSEVARQTRNATRSMVLALR